MADTKNNQAGERTQPCKLNTSRIPSRLIEAQKLLIKASAILGALEDDIQYATDDLELRREPFRDNFGGVRVPVTVHGINGRNYTGTYYKSSGDYARVKALKASK